MVVDYSGRDREGFMSCFFWEKCNEVRVISEDGVMLKVIIYDCSSSKEFCCEVVI